MAPKKASTKPKTKAIEKKLSFKCQLFNQGKSNTQIALFACSAKQIYSVVQVDEKEENKDKGYQRACSPARSAAIGRFIDAGNLLPTAVLLTFTHARIANNAAGSEIIIDNRPDAGWVIDGQHRLSGANEANNDITIPVIAFVGLDPDEQIKCFVTINKEQKGVPSSLYLDLLKKLPDNRSPMEIAKLRASDLADLLRTDPDSPFFERIRSVTSPKAGEMSLTNFVRKISPMVRPNGALAIFRDDERKIIISNLYRGLEKVYPKFYEPVTSSIFFKTLGFGALMNVLPFLLSLSITQFHSFRVGDVVSIFNKIDYFDFGTWEKMGSGNDAETNAGDDLKAELQKAFESSTTSGSIKLK